VSSDYLPYQFWDSLQGLSSYVRGMLAGQALLAGVGVGSAAATPLAAAFQASIGPVDGLESAGTFKRRPFPKRRLGGRSQPSLVPMTQALLRLPRLLCGHD
jgi:hypothetical protein